MLVSAVIPSFDRPQFLPLALRSFYDQDYPNLEAVIVDCGTTSVKHLVPDDPRIKYVRSDRPLTCGEARNLGTEHASGEIILNTDDDDWYSPERVSRQVEFHLQSGRGVTGYGYIVMHDLKTGMFNRFTMADPYVCGPTICYSRNYWLNVDRMDPINCEEDTRFVKRASDRNESARNLDDSIITIVARTHNGNTVSRDPLYASSQWIPATRPAKYFYEL